MAFPYIQASGCRCKRLGGYQAVVPAQPYLAAAKSPPVARRSYPSAAPGQAVYFSFSFPDKKAVLPVSPLCSDRVRKAQKQSFFRYFLFFLRTYPGALPKTSRTKSRCSFRFMPASCPAKLAVRPLSSSGYLFPPPSAPCFYAEKATPLSFTPSGLSAF